MGDVLGKLFIDPQDLPNDGYGFVQVLFLAAAYGFVLFNASNMISDGSELLLLVPALAGIVGSVVLPILGAVPDGAIVLFSGMGPDAQSQLSVGVGALAGSTIMLLTIPWALAVFAGRVNLDENGNGNYRRPKNAGNNWSKLMPESNKSLMHTGVVVLDEISDNAKTMIITCLFYLVLQLPAFKYSGTSSRDSQADNAALTKTESPFSLAAFILCILSFLGYLYWNVKRASEVKGDTVSQLQIQAIKNDELSLSGALTGEITRWKKKATTYGTDVTVSPERERLETLLRPFFHKYDTDRNGSISENELRVFFRDLNENLSDEGLRQWFISADIDKNGAISFEELVTATMNYLEDKYVKQVREESQKNLASERPEPSQEPSNVEFVYSGDAEGEEEESVPDDIAHLSVEEQQKKIKIRAAVMLSIGTILVVLFSDPMVDVLSEIGNRTGVPSFYVSFILAPLASNASELIAAYNYASKKTTKTISISLSTLLGAACMNNTFCLGIFAGLMYFRSLVWEFSAETAAIIIVQLIMGYFALRQTQRLMDALIVFTLYPLSLLFVALLENVVGLD